MKIYDIPMCHEGHKGISAFLCILHFVFQDNLMERYRRPMDAIFTIVTLQAFLIRNLSCFSFFTNALFAAASPVATSRS